MMGIILSLTRTSFRKYFPVLIVGHSLAIFLYQLRLKNVAQSERTIAKWAGWSGVLCSLFVKESLLVARLDVRFTFLALLFHLSLPTTKNNLVDGDLPVNHCRSIESGEQSAERDGNRLKNSGNEIQKRIQPDGF